MADFPTIAACLPGAEYIGAKEQGQHLGKVSAKVGPFQASFEGEADVRYDEQKKSVALEGKGVDRKGASRGKMMMSCALQPSGDATGIVVDSDIQLSGTTTQFGCARLVTAVAMFSSLIPCTALRQRRAAAFVGARRRSQNRRGIVRHSGSA